MTELVRTLKSESQAWFGSRLVVFMPVGVKSYITPKFFYQSASSCSTLSEDAAGTGRYYSGSREVTPVFTDENTKAALMLNHGTIGVGKTLLATQHVVELIEECAQIAAINKIVTR